jgi:hypothetical protein
MHAGRENVFVRLDGLHPQLLSAKPDRANLISHARPREGGIWNSEIPTTPANGWRQCPYSFTYTLVLELEETIRRHSIVTGNLCQHGSWFLIDGRVTMAPKSKRAATEQPHGYEFGGP